MKNYVLIALFLVSCTATSFAQDLNFGAKAGANFANLGSDFEDSKTRTSIHLGGVLEASISDVFSVQPELLYSSQGSNSDLDDDDVLKLDYLTIPILAKYYVADALSIEAGPQIGFLLSAKVEDDGDEIDIKDDTKSIDIGLALGLGYKLDSGINFGARYYFGSDINDIDEDPDKITNSVFQVFVGYFFN